MTQNGGMEGGRESQEKKSEWREIGKKSEWREIEKKERMEGDRKEE